MIRVLILSILAAVLWTASPVLAQTGTMNLSWTDNSSNEDMFKIERCTGVGCTNFLQIGTVGADVTKYADQGLPQGVSFSYRVRASNSAGDSGYTNVATAFTLVTVPNNPSGLNATPVSPSQISLNWENPDGSPIRLFRTAMQGSGASQEFHLAAGSIRFEDTGLRRNTTYCYSVTKSDLPAGAQPEVTDCTRTPNR